MKTMPRHEENKLGGVVEAAIDHAMADEKWLQDMADSTTIEQTTKNGVFNALEDYILGSLSYIDPDEGTINRLELTNQEFKRLGDMMVHEIEMTKDAIFSMNHPDDIKDAKEYIADLTSIKARCGR